MPFQSMHFEVCENVCVPKKGTIDSIDKNATVRIPVVYLPLQSGHRLNNKEELSGRISGIFFCSGILYQCFSFVSTLQVIHFDCFLCSNNNNFVV